MLVEIIKSMRPTQWVKNTVIFAPLIFSGHALQAGDLMRALYAFFLFCVLSGAVYILNDLMDREKDRHHPVKSGRPISSGRLAVHQGLTAALILSLLSLLAAFFLNPLLAVIAMAYLLLNLSYSVFLKRIILLDVLTISTGFVLRAVAGAIAIRVEITWWLVLLTFLLASFLAFSKRRHQLAFPNGPLLYTPRQLDGLIGVISLAIVLTYILYTIYVHSILLFTVLFVIYGLFRYLYHIYKMPISENPSDVLLSDRSLLLNTGLWLLTVMFLIY